MIENLLPGLRRKTTQTPSEQEGFVRPTSVLEMMEDMMRRGWEAFPSTSGGKLFPAVDVKEDEKEIVIAAEVPGMDANDIEVSIDGESLTIKGVKKFEQEEKKDTFTRIERSYGSFQRSFLLPSAVKQDAVSARYDKGVLTLTLPKSEEAQPRKVSIES